MIQRWRKLKGSKVDGGGWWESDAWIVVGAQSEASMQRIAPMCTTASLPKHTSISPAPSRRQANSRPSFSLYRFVVSRSRGGSHSPILLEPPRLTNAPPAPAVKEPLRGLLKTGRRLPGYPIISTEFPQAGACRRTDKALRACGLGWPASPTARHSWHRDCRLHYQAVPPCEKPRAPPLRTRSGCR